MFVCLLSHLSICCSREAVPRDVSRAYLHYSVCLPSLEGASVYGVSVSVLDCCLLTFPYCIVYSVWHEHGTPECRLQENVGGVGAVLTSDMIM